MKPDDSSVLANPIHERPFIVVQYPSDVTLRGQEYPNRSCRAQACRSQDEDTQPSLQIGFPLGCAIPDTGVLRQENPPTPAQLWEQFQIFRLRWEVVVVSFNEPPALPKLTGHLATKIPVAEEGVYAAGRNQNSYLNAA